MMNALVLIAASTALLTASRSQIEETDKRVTGGICVNLVAGADRMDIFVDGDCVWPSLRYAKLSPSQPLVVGESRIEVQLDGEVVLTKNVRLQTVNPHTIALVGTMESMKLHVIENKPVEPPDPKRLEEEDEPPLHTVPMFFFNASPNMPRIDVELNGHSVAPKGGLPYGDLVRRPVSVEDHSVDVFDVDSNALAWLEFNPKRDFAYGVFFFCKPIEIPEDEDEELEESDLTPEFDFLIVPHKRVARS